MSEADVQRMVDELERDGVALWVEDGQLRFRAPAGVMTPQRVAELRANKPRLLAHLDAGATGAAGAVVADPAARYEPFPLTDVQAAYLLGRHDAFAYGGLACHGYFEIAFDAIDPDRLAAAWRTLVARHDMLRATVHPDGYQRVLAEVPAYRIGVADLRGAGPGQVAAAVQATRADLSHRVYDPAQWPLFCLRVTRSGERDLLHFSIDLLIADYASVQILLAELAHCYAEPDRPLPPLEITFRDAMVAQLAGNHGAGYERARAWWHQRVDTLPPAPELPLRPRPGFAIDDSSLRTYRSDESSLQPTFTRWHHVLDAERYRELGRLAAERDLTASGALLAAYAEVLARWSRRAAFTLNLTLLNRPPLHEQVAGLVGDFTSVSLLAVDHGAGPDTAFTERATTLQQQLWRDLDHRQYSGIELMREIGRRRGAEAALMPVVFTSTVGVGERAGQATDGLGAGAELVYGISQTPQVWIDCQVMEHRGQLLVHWDVRDGVFPDGLVDDMFAAYTGLLHRLAGDGTVWMDRDPIQLPPAQAASRAEANATEAPLPDGRLPDGVLAQAARTPDEIAVIAADRTLTYAELVGRATVVASTLRAAGCAPAEPVAVVMDRGWEQVVGVLGVLLAGGAYLPIDTNQPPARRETMLRGAAVRFALTQSWLLDDQWPDGIGRTAVDQLPPGRPGAAGPASTAGRGTSPDDLAYVIYTSGSTGIPKGVMISHRSALNTIDDINARFGVDAGSTVLGLANLGFDLSVYDIFGPLATGGRLVLPDPGRRSDPAHWAELVAEHGVTLWNSVPAQLQMLSDYLAAEPSVQLPTLRLAMLSGDWIPVTLPAAIRERVPGIELVSLGGATEAAIWSIYHPIPAGGGAPDGWPSVPYGRPLANQRWQVLDAALRPCPDWVPGELYIGGAGLAIGYLGDRERTAERFVRVGGQRLYRTGDLGRYRPGGVIEFLGREDSQVKIRGHRIELAEVEAVLAACPAAGGSAVLVAGERPLERRLVAFVENGHRTEPTNQTDQTDQTGPGGLPGRLAELAGEAANRATAGVDHERVATLVQELGNAALVAMFTALRGHGLFPDQRTVHSFDEVSSATKAATRHHRLLRRWLRALADNDLLVAEPAGWRLGTEPADNLAGNLAACWARVDALDSAGDEHTAELVRYLRTSASHLPELLRDELDPLELLFPEGRLDVAEAAYKDNLISRYLNGVLAAALRGITEHAGAAGLGRPLRVLEVGAGVGGTTADLAKAVGAAEYPVDYLFTDLSQFFLNAAAERFAAYPWIRYGRFDLNADHRAQGMEPNTFDVVVCANVLHNALDAGDAVSRIAELVRPGGWLLFIEATGDNYPLMASMEFHDGLAVQFTDGRHEADRTFHSRQTWLSLLDRHGADLACCLPPPGHGLSAVGQHAFVARLKTDRTAVEPAQVAEHLAGRLPEYMIPSTVQVVDALPLTANGKVDRARLAGWVAAPDAGTTDAGAAPVGDLEIRLAALWSELLGVPAVGRDRDFFAAGGDSLLVAQLVNRMRERLPAAAEIGWDVLLRQVLRTPTVAGLAEYLGAGTGRTTDAATTGGAKVVSPLVTLRAAATGGQHQSSTVLVHDGSGTLSPYRALLAELGGGPPAGPVVGFAVSDIDDYLDTEPSTLLQRLATRYTAELLDAGHRRCHVVGYCLGGLLATEVATQLAESGAEVTGLTVISSYRVPYQVEDDVLMEYAFARVLGVDPAQLGYPADEALLGRAMDTVLAGSPGRLPSGAFAQLNGDTELAGLAAKLDQLGRRPAEQRLAAITAAAGNGQAADWLGGMWPVFRHGLRAVTTHQPTPYAGDITFLRQCGDTQFLPGLREDMTAFWRDLCLGELRVVDIAGDHFSCLQPPHVAAVAGLLAEGA